MKSIWNTSMKMKSRPMIIKDFFSHKIHSSGSDWPDKLVELAFIFAEFDGQLYDRDAIEKRLIQISPRSSFVARDRSRFRDVYSAYPAYFGLYRLEPSSNGWIIKLSSTTRLFLLQEEPDVTSFLFFFLTLLMLYKPYISVPTLCATIGRVI